MQWYLDQISNCTYRQFTTGFLLWKAGMRQAQIYDSNTYVRELHISWNYWQESQTEDIRIEQRNKFSVGETIEIMKPDGQNIETVVRAIINEDGETQESAPHSKQVLYVELDKKAEKYDILRRAEDIEA